jgi:hypothetical protein
MINYKLVSIVHIETVLGSKPHETATVGDNTGDIILGKSLISGEMSERPVFFLRLQKTEKEQEKYSRY